MDKGDVQNITEDPNVDMYAKNQRSVVKEVVGDSNSNMETEYNAHIQETILCETYSTSIQVQELIKKLRQQSCEDVGYRAGLTQIRNIFSSVVKTLDIEIGKSQTCDKECKKDVTGSENGVDAEPVSLNNRSNDNKDVAPIVFPSNYPKMDDAMMDDVNEHLRETLTRKAMGFMSTLNPGEMVDSEVVLKHMELIQLRSENCRGALPSVQCLPYYVFSWLYGTAGGGLNDALSLYNAYDIFTRDLLIVPLHFDEGAGHWALAVADFRGADIVISYYDSIINRDCTGQRERAHRALDLVKRYLVAGRESSTSSLFGDTSLRTFVVNVCEDAPQQDNDIDCGVFMLKFADYLASGLELIFRQEHMPYFRKVIAWEIINERLLMIPQQAAVASSRD